MTELATLLASGLGVADSVASVAAAHREDPLGPPFERLGREISQGKPFAEALQACGLALPAYFVQLARAALDATLADVKSELVGDYKSLKQIPVARPRSRITVREPLRAPGG